MPSVGVHLQQVDYKESVADAMVAAGFYDWAVVALFYAALNLMQAYLLEVDTVAETHAKRQRAILGRPELAGVVESYDLLKIQSENARYNCEHFDQNTFGEIRRGPYATVVEQLRAFRGTA